MLLSLWVILLWVDGFKAHWLSWDLFWPILVVLQSWRESLLASINLLLVDSNELRLLILTYLLLSPAFGAHYMIRIRNHSLSFNGHISWNVGLRHAKLAASLLDLVTEIKALHLVSVGAQTIQRRNGRTVHLGFVNKVIGHFWVWVKNYVFVVQHW